MVPEPELRALRGAAGLSKLDHVRPIRFRGDGAFDLLDALVSSRLFVRENEMVQTLLLDPEGLPFADAVIAQEEDALLLLAEGPSMEALLAHVRRVKEERCPSAAVEIEDLSTGHALFGVDGPYAWEVAAEALGPDVLGAPYLSFVRLLDAVLFRAGKTGEYGYLVLAPSGAAGEIWSRLRTIGAAQGAVEVSLAALDHCALENWHFSMRLYEPVARGLHLTPLELQLQWRVDRQKDFVGAPALKARRDAGLAGRVTCFTAGSEVRAGQPVHLGDARQGTVLEAAWSPFREEWIGWAYLDLAVAWPGLSALKVAGAGGPVAVTTRSPPLLSNRSLHVDPHRHSHQTRDQDEFPPLVPR
ncbi:MAG TPA: hypothetical protein VFA20_14545 [Myxococcaceae bacterium]|nr:hypothetical protein [Myxococcaceae bacterium]